MLQAQLDIMEFNLNNNMYNNFKYAIINSSEKENIDYTTLVGSGRENNDKSKYIVKYKGEQPASLNNVPEYTHQEILDELAKTEWVEPIPEALQEYLDGL